MSPSVILLAAADLIEKSGWVHGGGAKDANGNFVVYESKRAVAFSAFAALSRLSKSQVEYTLVYDAFAKVVGENPGEWHTAHGRTKEEVIEALRKAAKL